MKLSIVIPIYNEAESLQALLPGWLDWCAENGIRMVLVDDGSTDGTRDKLEKFKNTEAVRLVRHKVNRGYGAALKTGIRAVETEFLGTMDADGQHDIRQVKALFDKLRSAGSDMMIGSRKGQKNSSLYRGIGKFFIRNLAKLLMPIPVYDLNSGMKVYDAQLAKRYIRVCPDSMAFSDIITMVFISQGHLVEESPITIQPRKSGTSTINSMTAIDTVREIFNMVILFNPMRIFFPIGLFFLLGGLGWGLPIILRGDGVSVGSMLGIVAGLVIMLIGLMAEQLSALRKDQLKND